MGIEKTKLLACESIYWININDDIEKHIKIALHVLIFSKPNQKKKIIHYNIPPKLWEIIGADMFTLHNKNYFCVEDYHSKFPVIKKMEDLSADILRRKCQIKGVTLFQIISRHSAEA